MGIEIKRVALDFEWPIGKVWYGYYIQDCLSEKDYTGCDDCRKFAKIKGLEIRSFGCPDFEPILGPPKGDGYQLWENTSEGSPLSPVFETPEELAEWLEANEASSFGSMTCSYDQWLDFIRGPGWAPSMIIQNGKMRSGVCAKLNLGEN